VQQWWHIAGSCWQGRPHATCGDYIDACIAALLLLLLLLVVVVQIFIMVLLVAVCLSE
jgi:hypothetical protein